MTVDLFMLALTAYLFMERSWWAYVVMGVITRGWLPPWIGPDEEGMVAAERL